MVAGAMSGSFVSQPPKTPQRLAALPKIREVASCSVTPRDPIHGASRPPTSARGPPKPIQRCSSYRCDMTPRLARRCIKSASEQMDTKLAARQSPAQTPRQEAKHARTTRAVSLALQTVQRLPGAGSTSAAIGGLGADLAAARAAHKERVHAVERSQHFTHAMLDKIEALRGDLASCSTTCSTASPSSTGSLSCGSSSPRESP